nr:low affinity iron permease family protein [Rhizobium sp. Root708]
MTLAGGVAVAVGWIATGAVSGFQTWWYLYANIIGTLATVLILPLVQHSQNRNMRAMQIKVDELIRRARPATI